MDISCKKPEIKNIGFFHFTKRHDEPIAALTAELEKVVAADSLLVLPEAFNLGKPYSEVGGGCKLGRDFVIAELQKISTKSRIVFVLGVLESALSHNALASSSAYLVQPDGKHRLICYKELNDGMGHYIPCPSSPDVENPVCNESLCAAAIVCMDIQRGLRIENLVNLTEAKGQPLRAVCIPAAMSDPGWLGGVRLGATINLTPPRTKRKSRIILANCDPRGPGSFITDDEWKITDCVQPDQANANCIILRSLAKDSND